MTKNVPFPSPQVPPCKNLPCYGDRMGGSGGLGGGGKERATARALYSRGEHVLSSGCILIRIGALEDVQACTCTSQDSGLCWCAWAGRILIVLAIGRGERVAS